MYVLPLTSPTVIGFLLNRACGVYLVFVIELLYRSLIRSKLDSGCIVYGSARSSYLRMLDPIQNHALTVVPWGF